MKYLFVALLLLFSGCSIKNYEINQAKLIIIKSPKIKFADVGYLRHTDKHIALDLFVAGKAVEKIEINHLVCVREGCMSKSGFNQDYLHGSYPDTLLQNVLLGKMIYGGENMQKLADGYEQIIKRDAVDIRYTVVGKKVTFKDRKNKILFKIKDMQ